MKQGAAVADNEIPERKFGVHDGLVKNLPGRAYY